MSENEVQILVKSESGAEYDINNISGKRKAELIRSGEVEVDRFIAPPNMPGKKLAEYREAHRARTMQGINAGEDRSKGKEVKTTEASDKVDLMDIEVGMHVKKKKSNFVGEVIKVSKKYGVKYTKKDGTVSNWILPSELEIVKVEEEE